MDFSETYKKSGPCAWSPDGKYLAVVVDYRLVIRDVDTLQVVQLFSCLDKIEILEWAPDSEYILCGLLKRAIVQAWSLAQPDWTCKIVEGPAGIVHARWSPDSRHIITTSEFQLRTTAWSLLSSSSVHLPWPKHPAKGLAFSHDGKFMALAVRKNCKDSVQVVSCESWEILGNIATETVDLADLSWSPDDGAIVVWDSLLYYKVLLYAPDGRCMARFCAYENALGTKAVSWSPSGALLAVGSYDGAVRVLNSLTWKPFAEFLHWSPVRSPGTVVVYKEVDEAPQVELDRLRDPVTGMLNLALQEDTAKRSRYDIAALPLSIASIKLVPDKPNPKQGVGLIQWSAGGEFLVTRNEAMPTALWIWDMAQLELVSLLIQQEPIRAIAWDPTLPRLALCTGGSRVYMWSPAGASCVHIPLPDFCASDIAWNPHGSSFFLTDREAFCCAFAPPPADGGVV